MYIHDWHHSSISGTPYIQLSRLQCTSIHSAFPLLLSPLARFPLLPFCTPFLLTWNPPSCDRICPPRSQVACKLTSPIAPLTQDPPPSKFPEPQLTSALLRRPQEQSGVFCPEHSRLSQTTNIIIYVS
jgi:hypothetical protein